MSEHVRFYEGMWLQPENLFCFMTAAGGAAAAAAAAAAARTHVLENRSGHARPTGRPTDRPTLSNACA